MTKMPSAGSKDSVLVAVSIGPSFNYTSHKKDAIAGYSLFQVIDNAVSTAEHTFFNGQPAYLLDKTTQPTCMGDEAGIGGGVRSGTVGGEVKPTSGSSTIFIEGKALIREGDTCTMNNGNVQGVYVTVNASWVYEKLAALKKEEPVLFAGPTAGPGGQIEHYQPKAVRRDMTSGELRTAKSVFGEAINFGENGKGNGVGVYNGKWKPFQPDNRAMAPNGNIYFPGTSYEEDFSNLGSKKLSDEDRRTFIHEMTHVWQHQHGKAVKTRGAALGVLAAVGDPYIYKLYIPGDQTNLKDLSDYGLEQQAAIVGDYYALREGLNLEPYATNSKPPRLQDYEAVIGDNFKKPSPKVW